MSEEREVLTVARGDVITMFDELGVKTAGKWKKAEMFEHIECLSEMIDDNTEMETQASLQLCVKLLDAVEDDWKIRITKDKPKEESETPMTKTTRKKKKAKTPPARKKKVSAKDKEKKHGVRSKTATTKRTVTTRKGTTVKKRKPSKNLDEYGSRIGTGGAKMNKMLKKARKKGCSAKQLAEGSGMTTVRVYRQMSKLIHDGHVEKRTDNGNYRLL